MDCAVLTTRTAIGGRDRSTESTARGGRKGQGRVLHPPIALRTRYAMSCTDLCYLLRQYGRQDQCPFDSRA
eukprot:3086746-Rhodomonas_salina.1